MPLYRVNPGFEHGAFGRFKAGDIVEHTEEEAAGFADKLTLVTPFVPSPSSFDVAGNTVASVMSAVAAGIISAQEALHAERNGRKRKTLMDALWEIQLGPNSE